MDPITMAISAALVAGIVGGTTKIGEQVVVDAYDALKSIIKKKYGNDSKIVRAVNDFENEPEFEPYKMGLQQRVKDAKANQDTDVRAAALNLLSLVKLQPDGNQIIKNIQNVSGNYNAIAGASGQSTVNVNQPRKK